MRLATLLQWLHGKTSALCAFPFWQMMVWLAFMIDHSNVLTIASGDPLDFPAHVGATRLSKRDTLVCTIYNADLDMAGSVPPQVALSQAAAPHCSESSTSIFKETQDCVWVCHLLCQSDE